MSKHRATGPCAVCGEAEIVQEHHVNGVHEDDRPENKVDLCPNDHFKIHHLGYQLVRDPDSRHWSLVPGTTKSEKKIVEALAKSAQRGITITELTVETGMSRPTISHALDRLIKRNMVRSWEHGHYVSVWYLAEHFEKVWGDKR